MRTQQQLSFFCLSLLSHGADCIVFSAFRPLTPALSRPHRLCVPQLATVIPAATVTYLRRPQFWRAAMASFGGGIKGKEPSFPPQSLGVLLGNVLDLGCPSLTGCTASHAAAFFRLIYKWIPAVFAGSAASNQNLQLFEATAAGSGERTAHQLVTALSLCVFTACQCQHVTALSLCVFTACQCQLVTALSLCVFTACQCQLVTALSLCVFTACQCLKRCTMSQHLSQQTTRAPSQRLRRTSDHGPRLAQAAP